MNAKIFEDIGFTKSEIAVYTALLHIGSSKTGAITSRSKVSRSKIYEILEKLMQKGLVSYVIKENTKYFEAADPENIMGILERRKSELYENEKILRSEISNLKKIVIPKEKQTAAVYEGYKGIRTVFNDILQNLRKDDEYYAYANDTESYTKEFSIFIMNYHKKREEKGIKVKLLCDKKVKKRALKELGGYNHIQFRFTNESRPTSTLIYKNRLFIFTWEKPTAIMIESDHIVKQYKKHFIEIWGRSDK